LLRVNGGRNITKHFTHAAAKVADPVHRQLVALAAMTVGQLAEKHLDVYGEPTPSRNKEYLRKRLAWRIQELAQGGLSPRSLAKIIELGDELPTRWRLHSPVAPTAVAAVTRRDPRMPAIGTVLTRVHEGQRHEVTVGADTFTYAGREWRSLSPRPGENN
jgi:hypothetical protein